MLEKEKMSNTEQQANQDRATCSPASTYQSHNGDITRPLVAERLLTHCVDDSGRIHYLVQWRPSWEQATNIPNFDGIFTQYCERLASRA